MCRSRNWRGETGDGDSVMRHVPLAVFGNAITSRMLGVPHRIAIQPVEAEGDAAVRRGAIAEGFEHVAETQLRLVRRNLQHFFKHGLLHVGLVDTD